MRQTLRYPSFYDWIFKPNSLSFCVTEAQGVLTSTCVNEPPDAVLVKDSPATVNVLDSVVLDASGSTDAVTPAAQLQFRWDLDGDGNYDTDWSRPQPLRLPSIPSESTMSSLRCRTGPA